MRSKGHTFFHAATRGGKSTCSYMYDKTSTETLDAYLRLVEKYKACGQWFVAFTSHGYTLHTNGNRAIIVMFAHLLQYTILHKLTLKNDCMLYLAGIEKKY